MFFIAFFPGAEQVAEVVARLTNQTQNQWWVNETKHKARRAEVEKRERSLCRALVVAEPHRSPDVVAQRVGQ